MKTRSVLLAVGLAVLASLAHAATMPPLDPNDPRAADRTALRDVLGRAEKALNAMDVDAFLPLLWDDAIVVWQDAHRTTSAKEVRSHHEAVFKGGNPIVKGIEIAGTLDAPARFDGEDHATAWGSTKETYHLVTGGSLTIDGKWTAQLTRRDGQWKASALHLSTNPFENELLRKAGQMSWIVGAIAGVVGFILGAIVFRRRRT